MKVYLVLYFMWFVAVGYCQNKVSYKFCVYPNDHGKCADLDRGGSAVQCVKVQDSVDCALKINNGEADFGTFFPEQVHLVSNFLKDETAVIGELRVAERRYRNNSFQTVVLVKNNHVGGIEGLKDKKYCHPGFDYLELWTPRVRKELEYAVLKDKPVKCSDMADRTCVENEIEKLSQFFGDSCRPGPWVVENPELDQQLKNKYSKLCKLCDSQATCSYNNKDLKDNAMQCLKNKNADVAYMSLESLSFPNSEYSNYKLLCTDGTVENIAANIPDKCSWRNQPWTLLLARSEKKNDLLDKLRTWIGPESIMDNTRASPHVTSREVWMNALQEILTRNEADRIIFYDGNQSPDSFLVQKKQKLTLYNNIDAKMKWCTVSDEEKNKCEWLRQASRISGIEPEMECVVGQNVYDCFNKIKDKGADLISIDSRLGYLARKSNLQNLFFNDKSDRDVSSMIALLPSTTSVAKFTDLKGKKACFPEYRGLAWVSFVEAARTHKIIRETCDYGKSVSEFFSEACAPGAKDVYHYRSAATNLTNMCALCTGSCHADESNKYYKDAGALSCLKDSNADVAFLEVQALNSMSNEDKSNYKIMCKDGSVKNLDQITDFDECALSTTVDSEVIFRHGDIRAQDYKLALFHMEQLFGTAFKNEKTMEMFKQFNGVNDLMFKDTVLGFEDDSSSNQYVQNYKTLFKNVDDCFNAAWTITSSVVPLFFSILFTLFLAHNN